MPITPPQLDPRDEDQVVASVIDALPAEFSDRNPASLTVKLIEGIGAIYALLLYQLNRWPEAVELALINLLGLEQRAATAAHVTLRFTTGAAASATTVPAGAQVKTGADADALVFTTDEALIVPATGGDAEVTATCTTTGSAGNVPAATLTTLSAPIPGIATVTNPASATGGQDLETLAALKARTPLELRAQDRVVTAEDAALVAASVAGCERAQVLGSVRYSAPGTLVEGHGGIAVGILASDLNQNANAPLLSEVQLAIESKGLAGYIVTVWQPPVRLIWLASVEAELLPGHASADVRAAMLTAMSEAITALNLIGPDGSTITATAWPWGEPLYANEVIVLLDRVEGVRRIGAVTIQTSDNYGATWSAATALADISPGPPGDLTDAFGMLHWGGDHTPPTFTLTVL